MDNVEELMARINEQTSPENFDLNTLIFGKENMSFLQDWRNTLRKNYLEPLLNELKSKKPDDIKRMLDPFNVGDTYDSVKSELESYRDKVKKSLEIDESRSETTPSEKLEGRAIGAIVPRNTELPESKQQEDGEQKNLGEHITKINFADETKTYLKEITGKISSGKELEQMRKDSKKYYDDSLAGQEKLLQASGSSGFMGLIGKILAVAGVGSLLVAAFWDKIKPWLEKKLGINLDVFDKLRGAFEGIGKFFTMGGLKISFGGILNTVGKAFSSFGELIEGALKGAINFILPAGKTVAAEGGAAVTKGGGMFKGLLPKIAGGLFKGIGATFLKGIPVLGSLISFYFVYDRFSKGDYVGAVVDLVGGLANLLEFTPLAPLALPISLGAAALNAFLDMKGEGKGTAGQKQTRKLNALTGLASGIYNMIKKVPLIGSLITGLEGWGQFFFSLPQNDLAGATEGLKKMEKVPLFGIIPSMLLGLLDATSSKDGKITSLKVGNTTNFIENLRKRMAKAVLNWLPDWNIPGLGNIRGEFAKLMGIDMQGEFTGSSTVTQPPKAGKIPDGEKFQQEKLDKLDKLRKDMFAKSQDKNLSEKDRKMYQDLAEKAGVNEQAYLKLRPKDAMPKKSPEQIQKEKLQDLENQTKQQLNIVKKEGEGIYNEQPIPVQDARVPSGGKTLIKSGLTGRTYQASSQDEVVSLKQGGILDKNLQELKGIVSLINRNITDLNKNIINIKPSSNINVHGGGGKTEHKDYLMDVTRDPIGFSRSQWWVNSERLNATI